jgi:hypothetical protein
VSSFITPWLGVPSTNGGAVDRLDDVAGKKAVLRGRTADHGGDEQRRQRLLRGVDGEPDEGSGVEPEPIRHTGQVTGRE